MSANRKDRIRIGLVGAGAIMHLSHAPTIARSKDAVLTAVFDRDPKRAADLAEQYEAKSYDRLEALVEAPDVDAVIVATPAVTHARLARAALAAGKHVLVEKPLALSPSDAEAVVADAARAGRTLMVGHLMLFHPAVERIRQLLRAGELGQLYYIYALRVNLGRLRRDENAMWSLAPHDVSMILHLLEEEPESVAARGGT